MPDARPDAAAPEPGKRTGIAPRCVSIDREVGIDDGRIHPFAAMRGDTGASLVYSLAFDHVAIVDGG